MKLSFESQEKIRAVIILLGKVGFAVGCLFLLLIVIGYFFVSSEGPRIRPEGMTQLTVNSLAVVYQYYIADNGPMPKDTDNAAFAKLIFGDNQKKKPYLNLSPKMENSDGLVVDGWGTPLRITINPPSDVVIVSAGPDKIFGTSDDITADQN